MLRRIQQMPADVAEGCLRRAYRAPAAVPGIHYPDWYLHRWHGLPEGYLSARSVLLYDRYIRRLYFAMSEQRVHGVVAELLSRSRASSVLEIGCGPGRALAALGRRLQAATLHGVDLSPFMVSAAGRRLAAAAVHASVAHGDARHLGWSDRSFDAVAAMHLFGHVPENAGREMLSEVGRVLRPGGELILVEHRWHSLPMEGWIERERVTSGGAMAVRRFSRADERDSH